MTDTLMDSLLSKDQQKINKIINNHNNNKPTHVVMAVFSSEVLQPPSMETSSSLCN
jgi:hypothetical protein